MQPVSSVLMRLISTPAVEVEMIRIPVTMADCVWRNTDYVRPASNDALRREAALFAVGKE